MHVKVNRRDLGLSGRAGDALLLAALVFALSMLGILTRPVGSLAGLWPANAVLLGVLVVRPGMASIGGWLGSALGYLLAGVVAGDEAWLNVWLGAANMTGVMVGFVLLRQLSNVDRQLLRPASVLYLFAICALAAIAGGAVGSRVAPMVLGYGPAVGFAFWAATEMVNYAMWLPILLAAPWARTDGDREGANRERDGAASMPPLRQAAPLLVLALSMLAAIAVGGPGAILFPVPALLWCALTYGLFGTSVLSAIACSAMLMAVSSGMLHLSGHDSGVMLSISVRLGVTLLALAPLTVASIDVVRNVLVQRLAHAANHDALTDTLSRRVFFMRGEALLASHLETGVPLSLLVLDVDHFKQINDRFGHSGGDSALIALVRVITPKLRAGDLFGRLGGEEFGVLLPDTKAGEASILADGLRLAVYDLALRVQGDEALRMTVSIGVSAVELMFDTRLDQVIARADAAMYRAKALGRNRVEQARTAAGG